MAINKGAWMIVGIFLWGVPLGILLPFMSAFFKPGSWSELQSFQPDIFMRNLFITFPIFIVLGICYGLWMHRLSQKIQK